MISKILTLFVLGSLGCVAQTVAKSTAPAKTAPKPAPTADAAIRAVLERQELDWNRGDTDGYLLGYDKDTTYVGEKMTKGLEELRVRYQSHYPTRGSMGHLTFSDLEVKMLGAEYAYVIGHWRLDRKPEDGGDTGGMFTRLFRHTARGWKIVVDHTS
jgi:ketosteroid isomerase-like protein